MTFGTHLVVSLSPKFCTATLQHSCNYSLTFPALVVSLTSFVVQIFLTAGWCVEYSNPKLRLLIYTHANVL